MAGRLKPVSASSERSSASLTLADWIGAGRSRRACAIAVLAAVIVAHGCVADQIAVRMNDMAKAAVAPKRIEVAYVRELEQAAPPTAAPEPPAAIAPPMRAPRQREVREPAVPKAAASAASEPTAEPAPEPLPEPPSAAASTPEPLPPTVAAAASAASEPASAVAEAPPAASAPTPVAAAASAAEGFRWPASTRLTYSLVGYFRGDVNGYASVEWVRQGERYQVHLDVSVPPLLSRRMSSEGRLTSEGLYPERFDQDSKVAFRARQVQTMRFEPDAIVLVDGRRTERPPGLQDTTSQFVQLTYLFTQRPELLVAGSSVEVPLALPRRLDRWVYDVQGAETLSTPIGHIDTMYLKPRRANPKDGDLSAEIWIAPSLQYLPVRIRLRQDADTFLDLTIDRKPQLAAQ